MNKSKKSTQQQRSSNPHFRALVKAANKYISCLHHEANWQSLPKALAARVDSLIKSIHLPGKDADAYRESPIASIKNIIQEMGKKHLLDSRLTIVQQMAGYDMTDAAWAISIA